MAPTLSRSSAADPAPVPVVLVSRCPSWVPGLVLASLLGAASLAVAAQAGSGHAERIEARLRDAQVTVDALQARLTTQFAAEHQRLHAQLEQSRANEEQRVAREQDRARTAENVVARLEALGAATERDVAGSRQALEAFLAGAERREREMRDAAASTVDVDRRDAPTRTRDMLLPAVQLNGEDTVGSGTIVFSGTSPRSNLVETYVLTSYHVVRNIFADTPQAAENGIDVTVYLPGDRVTVKAKMVASETRIDIALLQLQTRHRFDFVASVLPLEQSERITVWDEVCAIGCPLGNDPVPSFGIVSSLRNELNGANYWMINAPTYFGNSGGAIYTAGSRQLIGVFSKIYTHGKGSPVVVPHMGLITPIASIREWMEDTGYAFVLAGGERSPALAAK